MIQSLASLMTASAMLLHAVLGCCVHHDHAHVASSSSSSACSPADESHQHHGHAHSAASSHGACCGEAHQAGTRSEPEVCDRTGGCGDEPAPEQACDEAKCQWVGTEIPAEVPAAVCAFGDSFAGDDGAVDVLSLRACSTPACLSSPPGCSGTCRVLARHQVWLL